MCPIILHSAISLRHARRRTAPLPPCPLLLNARPSASVSLLSITIASPPSPLGPLLLNPISPSHLQAHVQQSLFLPDYASLNSDLHPPHHVIIPSSDPSQHPALISKANTSFISPYPSITSLSAQRRHNFPSPLNLPASFPPLKASPVYLPFPQVRSIRLSP